MTNPDSSSSSARRLATVVICAVLLIQAGAVVGRVDSDGFPFVDYPMYSSARYEGDRMDDFTVYATLSDGRRERVTREDIYLDDFQYLKWAGAIRRHPRPPYQSGSGISHRIKAALGLRRPDIDLVRALVERYEQRKGVQVVRLEVESGMVTVTRTGMGRASEPLVLKDLPYSAAERALP